MRALRNLAILVALTVMTSACATKPDMKTNTPSVVFNASAAQTQKAAVQAMQSKGFKVTKSEPKYVEGARPRKFGLVVGSGGETVGLSIKEVSANKSEVTVDTAKSFVGIAGQRNWNNQILDEMKQNLKTGK